MEDRRKSPRRRVLKSATIAFDNDAVSATVRNLSTAGAALDVNGARVPHEFTLTIETAGLLSECHVIWRDARRIGVAFGVSPEQQDA